MRTIEDVVAILDEAKRTGVYDPLQRLFFAFMRAGNPDKAEIVQEALIEVARKLREGEPTILIAPQLGGILKNCGRRVREHKIDADERLALNDREQFLDVVVDDAADPALVFERRDELHAKIELLAKMKNENPRRFAVLQAEYYQIPVTEYFERALGETISDENGRKLRERVNKTFEKGLAQIRKDTSL